MQTFIKLPHEVVVRLGEIACERKCPSVFPVYLALLFHADRKGKCFPSYERIKEVSGISSDASVRKALRILEECGLIRREKRHGMHGNSIYYLQTSLNEETLSEEHTSINEECTLLNGEHTSMSEAPNFNQCSPKLQPLKSQTSMVEEELYSFNYNHLTISHLTKGKNENEREKENSNLPKSDLEVEREIKELFRSLSGRAMIPPEEIILAKMLYNLPADEVIAIIEDTYLKNPTEFSRKGLFLIPNWEAYQYG
ncbi:helix-turn-helix domain-containing protein [Atrimonas thermophila]|uniref:helix-turn-helix domain-containing protein n=2 Tax=Atrimonas thermophila TaxID=3064161 RepID=UPI00399CB76D